jgi:peptidoglycan/LPS O-acetylase OafA/YrhL
MKKVEIRPLTSLRFFAAVWVVAYHYLTPVLEADPGAPAWLLAFVRSGFVGVPVFFVLSGFVLFYNYEGMDLRGREARRAFWVARFARIYPVYILAFLLAVPPALYALWTNVPGLPSLRDHAVGAILSPLLLQAWAGSAHAAWNTPGWTLSVEAAFYVAFPWLAGLAQRRRLGRTLALATAFSAAMLAAYLLAGVGSVHVVMRNPLMHVPAFLAGMLLAQRREAVASLSPANADALAIGGLAGIAGVAVLLSGPWGPGPETADPLLNSILLVPLVALATLGLAAPRGALVSLLSAPVLVWLGNISYSVYILQSPLAKYVLYAPAMALGYGAATLPAFLAFLAVLVAASAVTYRFVERPWQRRLRAWLAPRPAPPVALLVGFAILAGRLAEDVAETFAMAGAFSGAKVRMRSVRVTMPSMTPRALTTGRPPTWLSSMSLAASLAVMSGLAVTTLRRM